MEREELNILIQWFLDLLIEDDATKGGYETVSLSEAHSRYGRNQVDKWVRHGLVARVKEGENNASVRFDLRSLDQVAKTSNELPT